MQPAQCERSALEVHEDIIAQGNKVRELKSAKSDKANIDAQVKILQDLKAKYKSITNQEWKPSVVPAAPTIAEVKSALEVCLDYVCQFENLKSSTLIKIV